MTKPKRRCWNGCAAEPWREGNVFCKECYDRVIATGSSRPRTMVNKTKFTAADNEAAKQEMLKVSYDDIKKAFLEAVAESHEPKRKAVVQ